MNNKERLKHISEHYNNPKWAQYWVREKPPKTWHERVHDKQLEFTLSFLNCNLSQAKTLKALDIGCSSGRYTKALLEKGIASVVGMDTAGIPLRKAKEMVPQGIFLQASITNLPFKRETFDIVVCVELFHHLTGSILDLTLSQIGNVLKPGGRLIFDIKNKLNPLLYLAYKRNDNTAFTLKPRTVREIKSRLRQRGFTLLGKKPIFLPVLTFAPYIVCQANKEKSGTEI